MHCSPISQPAWPFANENSSILRAKGAKVPLGAYVALNRQGRRYRESLALAPGADNLWRGLERQ